MIVNDGGDYNGLCVAPKASTCTSVEFSQRRPINGGDITTWHTFGSDAAGFLGACDGPPLEVILPVCPGQCYNVIVWEFVIDQPSGTGPNANGGAGGTGNLLPFPGMDANISCGNMTLLSESPPSDIVQICIDAPDNSDNVLIENPTLTVTNSVNGDPNLNICADLNGTPYTGTFQSQPEDIGDPTLMDPCQVSNVDVCNSINNITDPLISDGTVDQSIGGTGNGGDAGDLSVVSGGAGNSANGLLGLGAHVIEVNCREDIGMVFSTPEGCKGFTDQSVFGLPVCNFADGSLLSTNAKVYISVNGTSVSGVSASPYPACYAGGSGTGTCTTNNGVDYPADYTAQFGNFISDDGVNDPCITNLVGNIFQGDGVNPFTLPGVVSGVDFGDGVARDVSTVCVKYEDPCDGSKSVTCIKFISDASPLTALTASCSETCLGANDGVLYVYDIAGGSADPNVDAIYADGNGGGYVVEVTAGPSNVGSTLTNIGGSTWELTGMTPGVYTVEIRDNLAPNDLLNVEGDEATASCGAACPIERIIAVLPGPEIPVITTVVNPTCTDDGSVSIQVDRSTIEFVAQDTQEDTQTSLGASGPLGDDLGVAGSNPFDLYTSTVLTANVSLPYTGCNPVPTVNGFTAGDICFSLDGCGDAGDAYFISPDGTFVPVDFGAAIGGGLTGSETVCLPISTTFPGETINGTWTMFYADFGQNLSNNGFVGTPADCDITFSVTFNDLLCIDETDLTAFCGAAGPDEGDGAGNISSADQTLTWTSAGPDTGTEAGFDFITLSGPGENDATFNYQAAIDAGIAPGTDVCYDIAGFVPGNNFLSAPLFMDVQGTSPDCYIGACCPIMSQVCFTVPACFSCPVITDPTLTDNCSCDNEAATALEAMGTCPAVDFTSTDGASGITAVDVTNPFGAPSYQLSMNPSDFTTPPAGCTLVSAVVTYTTTGEVAPPGGCVPNDQDLFLMDLYTQAGGTIFFDPTGHVSPGATYVTPNLVTTVGWDPSQGLDMFVQQNNNLSPNDPCGGWSLTDMAMSVVLTYSCPAPAPMFTWYGSAGSPQTVGDTSMMVGSGAAFTPATGDVDIFGNTFDPAVCGNYTFCTSSICQYPDDMGMLADCPSELVCATYTVNPNPGSTVDLNDEVCEVDAPVDFDLGAANGGGTDFDVFTDAALTTPATGGTVTTGVFTAPDTAPGTYTYYYQQAGAGTCAFPNFVADANCVCAFTPGEITLIINSSPADPIVTPATVCEGNSDMLTATCGAGETTNWYADDGAGAPDIAGGIEGTGGSFSPTDTAPGTYTYYAECVSAGGCASNTVPVTYTINPVPSAAFTCPVLDCSDPTNNILELDPLDNNGVVGATGAWSGNGASLVAGGSNPGDISSLGIGLGTPGTTYTLTYIVTAPGGCTSEAMCTFTFPLEAEDAVVASATICEGEPAMLTATCGAGETVNWYADDGAGAPDIAGGIIATGGSFSPADTAPGTYTYHTECETIDFCTSNAVPVTLTIEPNPTIDTPAPLTCSSGPQPLNPNPTGGVYSGSGAVFVVNDQLDPAGQTFGTYDLTYTVGSCSVTIQFEYDTDCGANGGQF